MIIATNPAKPQPQEDQIYNRKSARALASSAWAFTEATLEGRTNFSPTLDQLLTEAAYLLDCNPMEVLDQCVVTNHVRCTTPRAYSSYNRSDELSLRREVSTRCISRHFLMELDYWKPEKLAVFSATARDALRAAGIFFHGYIAHPTALGKNRNRKYRLGELRRLKSALNFGSASA